METGGNQFNYCLKGAVPFIGIGLATFIVSCQPVDQQQKSGPNILFIVTDDQGPWTISFQSDLNAHTPNLDKLAESGAVFTNCFSNSANCSPSRATLITGRYPSETGVTDLFGRVGVDGLPVEFTTFPDMFKAAGYNTAFIGKWHLGEGENQRHYWPTNRGYEKFTGFSLHGAMSKSPTLRVDGEWHHFEGEYTSDLLTDIAMDYMDEFIAAPGEKPFLLSLHYWAPHANTGFPEGFEIPERGRSWLPLRNEDMAYWDTLTVRFPHPDFPNLDSVLLDRYIREYNASVHSVDRNFERLMEYLEASSIMDNTIIIFTSDHGYMSGHNGLWHKGRGWWMTKDQRDPYGIYEGWRRENLYDNTLKVPFIIKWPGVINEHIVIDEIVSFVDVFPTLLEMADIEKPEDLLLRGNSIVPLVTKEDISWENDLYAEFSDLRTYRTTDWKIVKDFSDNGIPHELYDLRNDPEERQNLYYTDRSDVIVIREKLERMLIEKMGSINDPLLDL
jgi:choline-sulfatase